MEQAARGDAGRYFFLFINIVMPQFSTGIPMKKKK